MSKSEDNDWHAIGLLDSPDIIRRKIMKAATDSQREIVFDESRPGICNLLVIYEIFSKKERAEIEARFQDKGYGDFKKELAEIVIEGLRPLQERYREITEDPHYLDSLLEAGAAKVRPLADHVLLSVKQRLGLG